VQGSANGPPTGRTVPETGSAERSELLERGPELALVTRVLERACAGEGRRLLIAGPPGIGKSSLLEIASALARERGMGVLRGEGLEEASVLAFAVTEQLLGDTSSDVASRGVEGDPQAAAARLAQHVLELASDQPLLLAVDDAQWADGPTLRWLAMLATRLPGAPILLALTVRSGTSAPDVAAWRRLVDPRRAAVLRPAPLSEAAAATLIAGRLGREPGADVVAACQREAQGNPFLLGVLGDAIRQAGAGDRPGPSQWIAELGSRALADTVAVRLGALTEDARLLVEAAAVTGDVGGPVPLSAVAGLNESRAVDAAGELAACDLVRRAASLEFTHPLVREAIRARVPAARRERLQRSAVRTLAAAGKLEPAATRLLDLPPTSDAGAVEILTAAASVASARGAPEVAAELLRRALAEPAPEERLPEIQSALAKALLAAGDPAALDALRGWLGLARSPAERAAAARALATGLVYAMRIREACDVLERVSAEVRSADRGLSEELDAAMVSAMMFDPALQEARVARLEQSSPKRLASELAHRMGLVELAIERHGSCAPAVETAGLVERGLAGGVLMSRAPAAYASALTLLIQLGRTATARTELRDAIGVARSHGDVVHLAVRLSLLAESHRRDGDLVGAEADVRTALDLTADLPVGPPFMAATLLEALIDRGEVSAAEIELRRLKLTGELPNVLTRGLLLYVRARVRIGAGALRLGLEDLLLAGADVKRFRSDTPAAFPWRGAAAEVLLDLGEGAQADILSGEQLRMAETIGSPEVLGPALRVRGKIMGGTEGGALLERAVELLERSSARLEHAKALTDLASSTRQKSPERTRDLLGVALARAEELGAEALVARARDELVEAGARPRRSARGTTALTPSERRIGELAAQGLSNREIAETLVVATKTVETHLGSAYRKLGIRSRAELASALRRFVESEQTRGKP
jgi:DNA-binding CsgD family transcriptional regulator/energy-coupling factor transporter ATP-binding protein EcfA2